MIELALAILATWRLSVWLWYERDTSWGRGLARLWPWAGRQLACFWCVSFWVGLAVTPLFGVSWAEWVLWPLALSGAVLLLSGGGRLIWREIVNEQED